MELSGYLHAPVALHPGKESPSPSIHSIGGWMGPRADLDVVSKRKITSPCRESNPDRPAS
jgi:hypothetical protein